MTRYLFACISSAVFWKSATVNALLKVLANQLKKLYDDGFTAAWRKLHAVVS